MMRTLQNVCALVFVFLCLLHYFSLRPLWLDELYVFDSIKTYNFAQIFGPLKTQQAFPRVYLSFIKLISQPFDNHVLALRFLPLLCMVGAFACWVKIYRRSISDECLVLLAMVSFTSSYRLTYYGAELKHYSMDVLAVALYLLFFMKQKSVTQPSKPFILTACLLPFLMFFSYGGFFVFWMVTLNLFLLARENKAFKSVLWMNAVISIACVFIYYMIDVKSTMHQKGLFNYWESYFIQLNSPLAFLDSLFEGVKRLASHWWGTEKWQFKLAVPFLPFFLFAIFHFGIKSLKEAKGKIMSVEALALALFLELFIFSLFRFYPFTGERITLFMAPFVIYLILKGMDHLKGTIRFLFLGYFTVYSLICLLNTFSVYLKLY
jgi:hypothetical protein